MPPSHPTKVPREIVVRADAHAEPAHKSPPLARAQKLLLAQALEQAEAARGVAETALVDFGRWVLINVFENDASAALDDKRANPVWHELLARAGGPTLRLARKVVYVALQMAAHDKRITDEAWRGLDRGRKELLLPLRDEAAMRDAARHVTELKMSLRATEDYVSGLRRAKGKGPRKRRVDAAHVATRLAKLETEVLGPTRERLNALVDGLDDAGRKRLRAQARSLASYAQALLRHLKD